MAVGYEHAAQLAAVFDNVGKIGYDVVDAEHIGVRERHAAVDDYHIVAVL